MSVVAGSLEIQLLTGMAQLRSDMSEAKTVVTAAMADITRAVKEVQTVLGTLGLTATVAGLYELAKGAIEGAAQMYRLSEMTGVAVESLSSLRAAAKLSNTDMDVVAKAIQKLSVNMVDARQGNTKAAQTFRALGIEVTDGSGKLKSADQVMLEIAKSQKNFSAGAEMNAAMAALFGQRIGTQLIPMLKELADKGTLASKVTTEQARQAHEFERQLAQLKAATDGVVRSLALDLLPIVMKLPGLFKVALEAVAAYAIIFIGLPAVFTAAMLAFDAYALRVYAGETLIGALVPATNTAILTIGPTWTAMATKFGVFQTAVMSGVALIAAAFIGWQIGTWLRENFVEAQLAGIAFVNGTLTGWETIKYAAQVAWAYISSAAQTALSGIGEFFASVFDKMAQGLKALGAGDMAASMKSFAEKIRSATGGAVDLDTKLAGLKKTYEQNKQAISDVTDQMASDAIANFNAGKAAEEHGNKILKLASDGSQGYQSLSKELEKYIALQEAWLARGRDLTEAEKKNAEVTAQIDEALKHHNITLAESVALRVKLKKAIEEQQQVENTKREQQNAIYYDKQRNDAKQEELALDKAMTDEGLRVNRELDDRHTKLQNVADDMQLQLSLLGATDHERNVALEQLRIEQQRLADIKKINEDSLLADKAGAMARVNADAEIAKAQAETKAGLQDQIDLTRQLADEGKTLWDDLWSGGHNTLKKLGDDIKKFLIDELYQLVVKKWVINVAAQMTGSGVGQSVVGSQIGGAGSNALTSLVGGQLGSTGVSGIISAISGGYAASATGATAFSTALGVGNAGLGASGLAEMASTGVAVGEGGTLAGIGGGAAAGLAAIPVAGWIALGALALYSIFGGKGGGPKTESSYGTSAGGGGRGDPSGATSIAQSIQQQYSAIAGSIGIANTSLANLGVTYATDPQGTAQTQLQVVGGNYTRSDLYGGNVENVGRSDADFQQAVALASEQLILKNLQAAASGQIGDFLKSIDITSASLDTITKALQTAQDVGTFDKAVTALGPDFANLTTLSIDAKEALIASAGGLQNFTSELNAFYTDYTTQAEKQDVIWKNLVATFTQANVVLPNSAQGFRDAVEAALTAGDTNALKTLLGAESAFKELYGTIDQTAQSATAATSALTEQQKALSDSYLASWAAISKAQTSSAAATAANWGTVISSLSNSFWQLMSSLQSEVDKIRNGWISDTTGQTVGSAQATFNALAKQAMMGDKAAAAQLPAAAEALLTVAQTQAVDLAQLRIIQADTAEALVRVQAPLQAQNAEEMRALASEAWGIPYVPQSASSSSSTGDHAARAADGIEKINDTLKQHAQELAGLRGALDGSNQKGTFRVRVVGNLG